MSVGRPSCATCGEFAGVARKRKESGQLPSFCTRRLLSASHAFPPPPHRHHYYEGSNALIYVVDSADVDRIDEAREELTGVLDSESFPKDAALVVFANKQDLPGALAPSDIAERMGLPEMRDRKWYVQGSCAANGDGLFEGLDWLATTVNEAQA